MHGVRAHLRRGAQGARVGQRLRNWFVESTALCAAAMHTSRVAQLRIFHAKLCSSAAAPRFNFICANAKVHWIPTQIETAMESIYVVILYSIEK
jgi:hypothetical protein